MAELPRQARQSSTDELAHDDEVDQHHWVPKREGQGYVQHCPACGAQYRNGKVVWL